MRSCYRFRVEGRVQGVFFRASTRDKACELGITGYVRNAEDGAVEGLACGEPESLSALRDWLLRGPRAAIVEFLDWQPSDAASGSVFEIRR